MENNELSEAMILLTHVWKCALRVKPFSDRRFNASMYDALELAIKAGLKFDIDDCTRIYETFHVGSGYFRGQILSFGDGFYSHAVISRNMSACHAFEHCRERKPFIVNNVDHPSYHVSGIFDLTRPRDRLAIGSKFVWQGNKVTVTSFDDKSFEKRVICCAYKEQERDERGFTKRPLKVEHLYKITHVELKSKVGGKG